MCADYFSRLSYDDNEEKVKDSLHGIVTTKEIQTRLSVCRSA